MIKTLLLIPLFLSCICLGFEPAEILVEREVEEIVDIPGLFIPPYLVTEITEADLPIDIPGIPTEQIDPLPIDPRIETCITEVRSDSEPTNIYTPIVICCLIGLMVLGIILWPYRGR